MKQAALKLMRGAGAFALMRRANRRRSLVLFYHRFSRAAGGAATSARAFEEQLKFLAAHYRVVPLAEIAGRVAAGLPPPAGSAAITIDDGYADAYEIAFPLLRRYGVPATLFVVTDFLDRRAWVWTDKARFVAARAGAGEHRVAVAGRALTVRLGDAASRLTAATRLNSAMKELPEAGREEAIARIASALGVAVPGLPPREFSAVTWDEAREMDAGGVSIGSHTVTHPILTNCDDASLRRELAESRARLEAALGRRVEEFCYPNGDVDARVRRETERAGYACAVTVEHGLVAAGDDALALPRVHTEEDFTHFLQSTSGFEAAKNRLRRKRAAQGGEPAYEY